MLVKSHLNEIQLLPALSSKWESGCVKGLRARGGFEVDIYWEKGKLTKAVITSTVGEKCALRTNLPIQIKGVKGDSKTVPYYSTVNYINNFDTKARMKYGITVK